MTKIKTDLPMIIARFERTNWTKSTFSNKDLVIETIKYQPSLVYHVYPEKPNINQILDIFIIHVHFILGMISNNPKLLQQPLFFMPFRKTVHIN
tara:strand:+ start:201 stop:482 length:282 start_codon:yes stop_codon:yes gene_type:complete